MRAAGRLPPGQSLTLKWPVLHEGSVPQFDPRTWDFRVFGLVKPSRAIHRTCLEDFLRPTTSFALRHDGEQR
jgi:DMSO/TMAO reductase YedYZ molybdopterin-dependent catalytic subunit